MKKTSILILILSFFLIVACSDDDDNQDCINYEEIANVTSVEAPQTATINQPVDVTVNFRVNNGCGEFAQFDESLMETTRTIAVEAIYDGCACTQVITDRTITYSFTPLVSGEHVLRFRSGEEEFIEARIMVEDPSE
ncbi:hypothetical protein MKO06_12785 [Gramella sp. GC03-9]|uniref:GOLD domain-containing protein n=1 Tax=Christiangramia oceanisediminis TaxID=2920386 RepID=A0A9X2KYL7_9FLAO|nr:hypothetical protein [Gramella oceanisediminis]MCP9200788.1 hypothetical protein [Gramella oceanisediminis]